MSRLESPPRRVLVICIRRLGDVLLCTPLIRSLRQAWPQARIEVLVNRSAAVTLQGNPDIDALIVQPDKPRIGDYLGLLRRIFRRYDLAVSTLYSDRPHLYALLAAPRRAGVIADDPGARWKRWFTHYPATLDSSRHTVEQYLQLADALGISRVPVVVPPQVSSEALDAQLGSGWREAAYAVLHPTPMYAYKAWPQASWQSLIQHLLERGLRIYLTGGPADAERVKVAAIAAGFDAARVKNLSGQLAFAQLPQLIAGAQLFIGPDTSVTHLAAATGVPTVALFGPTDPAPWGPWPQAYAGGGASPWVTRAALQYRSNVWIVQGIATCVPCLREGCDNHLDSRADCLLQLAPSRVIGIAEEILQRA